MSNPVSVVKHSRIKFQSVFYDHYRDEVIEQIKSGLDFSDAIAETAIDDMLKNTPIEPSIRNNNGVVFIDLDYVYEGTYEAVYEVRVNLNEVIKMAVDSIQDAYGYEAEEGIKSLKADLLNLIEKHL